MSKDKLSSFFSNVWYYHKWKILVGALAILTLAVTVTQCAKRDDPDISILYVGDMDIGKSGRQGIKTQCSDYYTDANGDGEKNIALTFMGEKDKDTKERLQIEVLSGDHSIYVLNKTYFDFLLPYKIFAPLKDVLGELPEGAVNEYGIELKYLDIAETEGFNTMPRNSIVCIRANAENGVFDYANTTPVYKNNADFFIKMCKYDKEGFRRETVQMALIGDRNLYANCVSDIEHSLYYVGVQSNPNVAPMLDYDYLQLSYKEGQHVFGSAEKQKAEALASGNKLLLLDTDVYTYLSEQGLLLDVKALNLNTTVVPDQYGIMLKDLSIFKMNGFYFADDHKDSRIYLCASKNASDYTVEILKYLYEFKA